MHLSGIEPPHMAPEATALSTELQVHAMKNILPHFEKRGKCKFLKNYDDVDFLQFVCYYGLVFKVDTHVL